MVVGFDRYINYYKIQYATLCIRENPGCIFIATNRDAVTHLTDAQEWAGNGSMVRRTAGPHLHLLPALIDCWATHAPAAGLDRLLGHTCTCCRP